jgi:hypothetical protein
MFRLDNWQPCIIRLIGKTETSAPESASESRSITSSTASSGSSSAIALTPSWKTHALMIKIVIMHENANHCKKNSYQIENTPVEVSSMILATYVVTTAQLVGLHVDL